MLWRFYKGEKWSEILSLLFYCFTLGNFFLDQAVNITAHHHIKMCVWFLHRSNWNSIVYIEYFFNDNFIICNGYSDNSIACIFCKSKVFFSCCTFNLWISTLCVCSFSFWKFREKAHFFACLLKILYSSLFGFKSWLNINILCSIQSILFYCLFHTIL